MESISPVFLARSYLPETHNQMGTLESKPSFSMAGSALQNVLRAIACASSKDAKVPLKANLRMCIIRFPCIKETLYSTQHSLTMWFSLMEKAVTTRE